MEKRQQHLKQAPVLEGHPNPRHPLTDGLG
jgi:hypothetical protein